MLSYLDYARRTYERLRRLDRGALDSVSPCDAFSGPTSELPGSSQANLTQMREGLRLSFLLGVPFLPGGLTLSDVGPRWGDIAGGLTPQQATGLALFLGTPSRSGPSPLTSSESRFDATNIW